MQRAFLKSGLLIAIVLSWVNPCAQESGLLELRTSTLNVENQLSSSDLIALSGTLFVFDRPQNQYFDTTFWVYNIGDSTVSVEFEPVDELIRYQLPCEPGSPCEILPGDSLLCNFEVDRFYGCYPLVGTVQTGIYLLLEGQPALTIAVTEIIIGPNPPCEAAIAAATASNGSLFPGDTAHYLDTLTLGISSGCSGYSLEECYNRVTWSYSLDSGASWTIFREDQIHGGFSWTFEWDVIDGSSEAFFLRIKGHDLFWGAVDTTLGPLTLIGPRTNWYVSTSGSDTTGEGSETDPFATIQHAIDVALNGDTVSILPGTYTGTGNTGLTLAGKQLLVTGTSDIGDVVIDGLGASFPAILMQGEIADSTSIFQSLTIEEFDAEAVLLVGQSCPKFNNVRISRTGSAVSIFDPQSEVILNSMLLDNNDVGVFCSVYSLSGGIVRLHASEVRESTESGIFVQSDFDSSFAGDSVLLYGNATGISVFGTRRPETATMRRCMFLSNDTSAFGDVTLVDCSIDGGQVGLTAIMYGAGASFRVVGGTIRNVDSVVARPGSLALFEGVTIDSNPGLIARADPGSPIDYRFLEFDSCVISNNGAGIAADETVASLQMEHVLWFNNGGGIEYNGYYDRSCSIRNSTFYDNASTAVSVGSASGSILLENNIVYSNDGIGIEVIGSPDIQLYCNDVVDNLGGNYSGIPDQTGVNGNFSIDPDFCNGLGIAYTSYCAPEHSPCGLLVGALSPNCTAPCCRGMTGNVDYDIADQINLTDLTKLVNHLFVTFEPIVCKAEANTNGDPNCDIDLSDLTSIVNHLFVTFQPLADCSDFNEATCGQLLPE